MSMLLINTLNFPLMHPLRSCVYELVCLIALIWWIFFSQDKAFISWHKGEMYSYLFKEKKKFEYQKPFLNTGPV